MDQKTLTRKRLLISVAGGDGKHDYTDVEIVPGTRARDILAKLGLHGLSITNPKGGVLDANADLFPLVADGQKLIVAKSAATAGI